jgi:hypothetical protein
MKYCARISLNGEFYGYLEVVGKLEWKTKRTAEKHAKEFCASKSKNGFVYTYTIEGN